MNQSPPPPLGPRDLPEGWASQPPQAPQAPQAPQPPRREASAGRIILGAVLGAFLGFIAPFLPGFLVQVFFNQELDLPAGVLGLLMLITVPGGALLGGFRAAWRR